MKRGIVFYLIVACITLLYSITYSQNEYFENYQDECQKAMEFFDTNSYFIDACDNYNIPPEFLFAIVAPEISLYWATRDFAETASLNVLYVQGGKEYGNFSIGLFQMKPSFIEKMEEIVINDSVLRNSFQELATYQENTEKEIRRQRIRRLSSMEEQIQYLVLFYYIMESRYDNLEFKSELEKLQFYASAYNFGFDEGKDAINEWIEQRSFPGNILQENYSFAKIAVEFYNQCKYTGAS